MRCLLVVVLLFFLSSESNSLSVEELTTVPEDTYRNIFQLATSKGYPIETYTVQTPDGYLLSVQRIPYGKRSSRSPNKPVVLLVHAFEYDASEWLQNDESMSLGYLLADNGYDVWLANVRGNLLASRNVRLSPDDIDFWDFSFQEMAQYDIPSTIDFILSKTGQDQLNYIGHSQGTTIGFALLSESPIYNQKIKFFIALTPVAYVNTAGGLLGAILPFFLAIEPFYKDIGFVELLTRGPLIELFDQFICGTPLRFICADLYFSIAGYNPPQLNYTRLPVYFKFLPSGTSVKDFIHYAQMKYSRSFRKYDYYDRNQEIYNQPTPPTYDLTKITTPIATLSSQNDLIANPTDVATTESYLRTLVESYVVPLPSFNHLDFTTAIDTYPLVNKKVLSLLKRYGIN